MTAPTTAHFLTDIEIKEFKCFKDFKASGFKRVNLIGGKNNVGKTALLEACFINVHSVNVNSMATAIFSIKYARENLNILHNLANNKPIDKIQILDATKNYSTKSYLRKIDFYISEKDAIKEYNLSINNESVIINAKEFNFIFEHINNIKVIDNFGWSDNDLAEAYEAIQKHEKETDLSALVQEFDNSIDSFKLIGGTKPQCKTKGEWRDITEFGDGLRHYISIICALYACENGYLFIDEIDNGIYYDHLDRLWEIILTLSKKTNCQIFATTHSKEMLESFARVAKKLDEQDISYTLLVKDKQQEIKSITDDYEMLLDSIEQKREVRGW
ncbi:MAG: AAA family ATPase [Methylococcales bacterium]|nr:AAA family ATPase [Methylococcales bacterium]